MAQKNKKTRLFKFRFEYKMIQWKERKRNEKVLNRMKEKREFCHDIKACRSDKIIGHLLRYDKLPKSVIEGDVDDHDGRERLRME